MCVSGNANEGRAICCCCCNLTIGMIIIGSLMAFGGVVNLIMLNILGAAWNLGFAAPFLFAALKQDCVKRRKIVWITFLIKCLVELVVAIIALVVLSAFYDYSDVCVQ